MEVDSGYGGKGNLPEGFHFGESAVQRRVWPNGPRAGLFKLLFQGLPAYYYSNILLTQNLCVM